MGTEVRFIVYFIVLEMITVAYLFLEDFKNDI